MKTPIASSRLLACAALLALGSLAHAYDAGETLSPEEAQRVQPEVSAYQQGKTRFAPKTDIAPQGKCPDDVLGTFAIPADPPVQDIGELAAEVFGASYRPGQPVIQVAKTNGKYTQTNLLNNNVLPTAVTKAKKNDKLVTPDFVTCVADFGPSNLGGAAKGETKLISVDYSKLSAQQIQDFAQYVAWSWDVKPTPEDIANVHYFWAFTRENLNPSLPRVWFFLPLQKLSKP